MPTDDDKEMRRTGRFAAQELNFPCLISIPHPGAAYAGGEIFEKTHDKKDGKMIQGTWIDGTGAGFASALALRTAVFCEELGVPPEEERDAFDEIAAHVLILDEGGSPAATGRLFPAADGWHIGRLCVRKDQRGKGLGDMALRMLLFRAVSTVPDAELVLSARVEVAPWYVSFGFRQLGEVYDEAGLPHVRMRARAKDIALDGTCGKKRG